MSAQDRPTVTHRAEVNGTGGLTAGRLLELVHELADSGVPPQAFVTIRTEDSQREGQTWRLAASW